MPGRASTITAGELALVCARYDVGDISRVRRLKRGSGSSPKVILETSSGTYILKRLAPARAEPRRVAFGHELQLFLIERGFPAPALIGTRASASGAANGVSRAERARGQTSNAESSQSFGDARGPGAERVAGRENEPVRTPSRGGNSMLQMRGSTYELHRYIQGREDSRLPADSFDAGHALAWFHSTLESFHPTAAWVPAPQASGTYHDSDMVPAALSRIPKRFDDPDRREVILSLTEHYRLAAAEARACESDWRPAPFIHGDWHPGNLVFRPDAGSAGPAGPSRGDVETERGRARKGKAGSDAGGSSGVVCVLDFDSARPGKRMIDVANGALQFSLWRPPRSGGSDVGGERIAVPVASRTQASVSRTNQKPAGGELDLSRYRAFLGGYDFGHGAELAAGERRAVPWLMIQALIAEAALPIAITGRFGKVDPMGLLRLVRRKVAWIAAQAGSLQG